MSGDYIRSDNLKAPLLKLSLGMLMAWGVTTLYRVNVDNVALEKAVQGMSEYEVCQFAANNYDEKMVKDMGCMDGRFILESPMTASGR